MQVELIRSPKKCRLYSRWKLRSGNCRDQRICEIGLIVRAESPLFCVGRRMFPDMTISVHAISDHIQFGT